MRTKANIKLIDVLRETARRLSNGAEYNWCHMGRCNCGHIAQTITKMSPAEIHEQALLKAGDWSTQSIEHCTTTGYTIDHVISTMMDLGLTRADIVHIERLSDQHVLKRIDLERRKVMNHKKRENVILYINTFASMLEEELLRDAPNPADLLKPSLKDMGEQKHDFAESTVI